MQINVGEWIRTKQGSIHKAKSIMPQTLNLTNTER